jgi:uncharacterized protein (DUF952 family)
MSVILHLARADHFQSIPAHAPYRPPGFEADGFVHCAQGAVTLLHVANMFYRDAPGDFVVLVIDERQVAAPVKYEPPAPLGEREVDQAGSILFPHIYGPINREAIVGVVAARRGPAGEFFGFDGALDAWEEGA